MSIKKTGLLVVVLLVASYTLYSTYFYKFQDNFGTDPKETSVFDDQIDEFLATTEIASANQSKAVVDTTQCSNILSDLLLAFPSTDVFLDAHQDMFDQWVFKNTELSIPIKHKVADTLGLSFIYKDKVFDQHKRKPISFDNSLPQHQVSLSDMFAVYLALEDKNFDLATSHIRDLVEKSPKGRFSFQVNSRQESFVESILAIGRNGDSMKLLDVLVSSGYEITASDLIDAVSESSNIEVIKTIVDVISEDVNFIFSTRYSNDANNLVLHSIKHNRIDIAEYFLSRGVEFGTDLELQRSIANNIVRIPDDVATNTILERLLERGVFQFNDAHGNPFQTSQDSQSHNENLVHTPSEDNVQTVFDELTKRFGEQKANEFVANNNKQDLLSGLQRKAAAKIATNLLSESMKQLPPALKNKVKQCKSNYAETFYSLQKALYEKRVLSLYDELQIIDPAIDELLQGVDYFELNTSQVAALDKLSSYAAKSMLTEYFLHEYQQRQREKNSVGAISETFQKQLEEMLKKGQIDNLAGFIENSDELSQAQKASMLFEIHLLLGTKVNDFSILVSSDLEINFIRMVQSIQKNNFDTLKQFAEHNVNIDSDAIAGQNLLWHAVRNASKESFDYLLANNARLQPANSSGLDALDTALENIHKGAGDFYFVQQLLNNGHEIQASHKELLRAISDRHYDSVVAIIDQYDIDLETDP